MLKKIALSILIGLLLQSTLFAGSDGRQVQGMATAANGAADATVLAAPNAGQRIRVQSAVCSVVVAAVGGGGELVLEDGLNGTKIFRADADAVGVYALDFGGQDGYLLTAATLLNLTVEGAVTTQATGTCTVTGEVIA